MGIITANKTVSKERIECGGTVKVTLSLTAAPCHDKGAQDIVIAIDRSEAMKGEALEAAKKGIRKFLDTLEKAVPGREKGSLKEGIRIGLVSFSDSAAVNAPLSSGTERAVRAAEGMGASGKSNPADGIRAAVKLFDLSSPAEKMLFLITDGQTRLESQADAAAADAKQAGISIYCIGIAAPEGIKTDVLQSWASGPADSHVIEIRQLGEAEETFEGLLRNWCRPGATDIVVDEEINDDFCITSILTPTKGTASMINKTALQWKIDCLGGRENEGAVLEFYIRHTSRNGGRKRVNRSVAYSDAQGNMAAFPCPCITVDCCDAVRPDGCQEAVDFSVEGCREIEVVDMGKISQEGLGRIVELNATIKNVCPGKRTAVAAILTEIGRDGKEHERGMKMFTIPAQNGRRCRDVQVKGIKFVLPEDLTECGGSMCTGRMLRARFIAHSIDSGFDCGGCGEEEEEIICQENVGEL